jgi:hypothetical protein
MTSYVVAAISIIALLTTLYKDRKLAPNTAIAKRALRINTGVQIMVALVVLFAAIKSNNEASRVHAAQLDADATSAASQHAIAILDTYFLEMRPAAFAIQEHDRYEASLSGLPAEVRKSFEWNRAAPGLETQRETGLRAFEKLQMIARQIMGEKIQYGDRYPDAITKWAEQTLALKQTDVTNLLSDSDSAQAYVHLTGQATFDSFARYRSATKRITE